MKTFALILMAMVMFGCGKNNTTAATSSAESVAKIEKPAFCGDSAYAFVAQQVAFGPRVPGSQASAQCAEWLASKLSQYGAQDVKKQTAQLKAYNGDKLDICNISARFNPEAQDRVLLLAHWDSRPWADEDSVAANHYTPIDGANDGASGVGVILEMARQFAVKKPRVGVDVLLVDAEDYGPHAKDKGNEINEDGWALGTQYWVNNPTIPLTDIKYAVLLDMVGGKDAKFMREYHSEYAAQAINDRVWAAAQKAGAGNRFVDEMGGAVVDDHIYLLIAGVPAIDIIEAVHPATGSFPPYWHTVNDNMSIIDPETLRSVGQTLIELVY